MANLQRLLHGEQNLRQKQIPRYARDDL